MPLAIRKHLEQADHRHCTSASRERTAASRITPNFSGTFRWAGCVGPTWVLLLTAMSSTGNADGQALISLQVRTMATGNHDVHVAAEVGV